ncbi:RsbRD N-terminal domain-containing protein [Metapseudomonas resinovorans]|uniref:RsbRD N-terminal domain-containing protein n=1 Tax=Metapseudomonas resinovorans TaxID=53412 RepID=UPI000985AB77|nr:RsbRD N-terminal domain-containing protein [Pseudomonas resinovorans]
MKSPYSDREVEDNAGELLKAFTMALAQEAGSFEAAEWQPQKLQLERLSVAQARQGFSS